MAVKMVAEVLRNSILITGLVLIMMLMIEYFNIYSQGRWFYRLRGSRFRQILLAAFLGLIPGCVGGFAAVSLFTHRLISFGALVAMMICSSGDEAFVILAMIPGKGLLLFGILAVIAVVTGWVVDRFVKHPHPDLCPDEYELHSGHDSRIPSVFRASSYRTLLHPSRERIALLAGMAVFIAAVAGGFLEHEHAHGHAGHEHDGHVHQHGSLHRSLPQEEIIPERHRHESSELHRLESSEPYGSESTEQHGYPSDEQHGNESPEASLRHDIHEHHGQESSEPYQHESSEPYGHESPAHEHEHGQTGLPDARTGVHSEVHSGVHSGIHSEDSPASSAGSFHLNLLNERWINLVFAALSLITLLLTATASEHFVKEHLWEHVIRKHLLPIFLWTFGALLVCQIGIRHIDAGRWISNNMLAVILLAVAVGIIPESGPHLIFVTLYAQGLLPFYVLLVNSIVQDGHTTLPLLAESKSAFLKAKLVNVAVGLLTGLLCWAFL